METVHRRLPSGDLSSRRLAISQRRLLEDDIASPSVVVVLDLADVTSISESYADEIFGVLVSRFGLESVISHLKIQNASSFVLRSIASVMKRRTHERESYDVAC